MKIEIELSEYEVNAILKDELPMNDYFKVNCSILGKVRDEVENRACLVELDNVLYKQSLREMV